MSAYSDDMEDEFHDAAEELSLSGSRLAPCSIQFLENDLCLLFYSVQYIRTISFCSSRCSLIIAAPHSHIHFLSLALVPGLMIFVMILLLMVRCLKIVAFCR